MEKNLPYRTIGFSILGNILLAVVKIAAGILGNSYALVADGIESVSDVFSSILVLVGLRYAQKPADKNHPCGLSYRLFPTDCLPELPKYPHSPPSA